MDRTVQWFEAHETLALAIGVVSVLLSVGGILAAPFIVACLPEDYFLEGIEHPKSWSSRHQTLTWIVLALKNLLGVLLVVAGFILSLPLVPGPGVLTMLLGISLLDFPGKRKLERKIIGQPQVLAQVNRLRHKLGHPPLKV